MFGDEPLTAAAVTARLGVTPTDELEVGSRRGPRSPARTSSLWSLSTGIDDGVELSDQIQHLLDRLEPVTPVLLDLVREGYEANWFCYLGSHAADHAAELDRALLERLLLLPGDLWLDVYGDGEDEET